MTKRILFFSGMLLVLSYACTSTAADDAVAASAVFEQAESLLESTQSTEDAQLQEALDDLQELVVQGKRHLLNRKVHAATLVAERVSLQLEYISMLGRLAELAKQLKVLQDEASALEQRKILLKAQHERLILLNKGRTLTGAYPAVNESGETAK